MSKVGDIVKCISGQMYNGLAEGSVYKVKESWIERQEHFIKVHGLSKEFFQARFVKVNSFKGNK